MHKHNVIFALQQPVAAPLQQQVMVIEIPISTMGMRSCTANRTCTDLQTILAVCMRIVAIQHVNIADLHHAKVINVHVTGCWSK